MKKIALLSLLFVLFLTACKETEPDQNSPVVENNDKIDSGDGQDKSDGEQDETENENSGIVEEDQTEEIEYLKSLGKFDENESLYVEGGEIKQVEWNDFSGVLNYKGNEVSVSFQWFRKHGMFITNPVYIANAILGEEDKNKVLYGHYDSTADLVMEYICDLSTGVMEPAYDFEYFKDDNVMRVIHIRDSGKTIINTLDAVYLVEGEKITDIGKTLVDDRFQLFLFFTYYVDSRLLIGYQGTDTDDRFVCYSYEYDFASGEFIKRIDGMECSNSYELSEKVMFMDCAYGICERNGHIALVDFYTGRINETKLVWSELEWMKSINDKYFMAMTLEGYVVVINKANGRIVGQTDLPINIEENASLVVIPSDEDIYAEHYTDNRETKEIYKIELEE